MPVANSCRFSRLGNRLDGELNRAAGGRNDRLPVGVLEQIEELGRIVVPVADYGGDVSGEFLTAD